MNFTAEQLAAIAEANAFNEAQKKSQVSADAGEPKGVIPTYLADKWDRTKNDLTGFQASARKTLESIIPGAKQAYGDAFDPAVAEEQLPVLEGIGEKYNADIAKADPMYQAAGAAAPALAGGFVGLPFKLGAKIPVVGPAVSGVVKPAIEALRNAPLVGKALRTISPALDTATGRVAASTGAGVAGAEAGHLLRPIPDPEKEERTDGMGTTALWGMIPGGITAGGELRRALKNTQRPNDAARAALFQATGATPHTKPKQAYDEAVVAGRAERERLEKEWGDRKTAIEGEVPTKISMTNTSGLSEENLPDEVKAMLTKQYQGALQRGSTHVTPITQANLTPYEMQQLKEGKKVKSVEDKAKQPAPLFTYPTEQSVGELRDTLRMVRSKLRQLGPDSPQRDAYLRLEDSLGRDLSAWGRKDKKHQSVVRRLDSLDSDYSHVLDLKDTGNKGRPVANWAGDDMQGGTWLEQDFNAAMGGPNQGGQLQQAFDTVPGARAPILKYMGAKDQGEEISPLVFDPNSRRDVKFAGQDPAYLTLIRDKLRQSRRNDIPSRALRIMEKTPVLGGMLEKLRVGVPLYKPLPTKRPNSLANILRGYGVQIATDNEDQYEE